MRTVLAAGLVLFLSIVHAACPGRKEGAVEGRVSPAGPGIRIAVLAQGKVVKEADAGIPDGGFRIMVPAGSYEIRITSPASPFPLSLNGIVVTAGDTTSLTPLVLSAPGGTGRISGKVVAPGQASHVVLLADGVERASVNTGADGKYEFEGLPSGSYSLLITAPGYAKETVSLGVADDQRTSRDIRMLYITSIEGIDWNRGTARARGIGLPGPQASTPTVRRELAKRAALADAERNMIRMIELIHVAPDQKLAALVGTGTFVQKLSSFLQGYRITAERDLDGGKIEIEIELPLAGPGGLASFLQP